MNTLMLLVSACAFALCLTACAYYVLTWAWPPRPPVVWASWRRKRRRAAWWQRLVGVRSGGALAEQYEELLQDCGWGRFASGCGYAALRRVALGALALATLAASAPWTRNALSAVSYVSALVVILTVAAALLADKALLGRLREARGERILEEIFAVTRQLLYYNGSRLHLHGKLARCLPFTRRIRSEWLAFLNAWYDHPEEALARLKDRLNTTEGRSFAETLRAIHLHNDDNYYELLRERLEDYKQRLRLRRSGRKEGQSYGLFVLAGLPIMHTFRVFLHPWVQEGRHLFETLQTS